MRLASGTDDYPEEVTGITPGGEFKAPAGYSFTELKPDTAKVICRDRDKIVYRSPKVPYLETGAEALTGRAWIATGG